MIFLLSFMLSTFGFAQDEMPRAGVIPSEANPYEDLTYEGWEQELIRFCNLQDQDPARFERERSDVCGVGRFIGTPYANLSCFERMTIRYYTLGCYQQFNQFYRDENPRSRNRTSRDHWRVISAFEEALSKVPMTEAGTTCFRGAQFHNIPQILAQHREGRVVRYLAPTSTALDEATARQFAGRMLNRDEARYLIIRNCRGYRISELSAFRNENEVLLPPNQCFRVVDEDRATRREIRRRTQMYVELELEPVRCR